jgi:uncharacterized protein (DUF433 family)
MIHRNRKVVMEWQQYIEADPAVLLGKPVIKGTRISVELVLEFLSRGWAIDDVLSQYPHLSRQGVVACVEYARELVKSETVASMQT